MGGSLEVGADDDLQSTLLMGEEENDRENSATSSGLSSSPLVSTLDRRRKEIRREEITDEAKTQLKLVGPLIGMSLPRYCLQLISLMYVGHLGELPLSSASMATTLASVASFSILESHTIDMYLESFSDP